MTNLPSPSPTFVPGDAYYINDTKTVWLYVSPGEWAEWIPSYATGPQGPAGPMGPAGQVVWPTPPASEIGAAGDTANKFAVGNGFVYFCTGNYDGVTPIWTRTPLLATW